MVGGKKDYNSLHVASYAGNYQIIEELLCNEEVNADMFSRTSNFKLPRQLSKNGVITKLFKKNERKSI